ncbi:RAMP superfamily CRISPR-associated protein [uncultured Actinomyces sp.]|uniref:RAMP superfamily CRISPR-associated protein n=1 Tax=uncultured Actinomyces sp. TaxID=249061 RepID=UPI0028E1D9CA|nr:RAMP superfamily CRISPR-associated protein [uncultured Actinomyces sp.]
MSSNNQKPQFTSFHSSVNCIPVLRTSIQKHVTDDTKREGQSDSARPNLPETVTTFLSDRLPTPLDHLGIDTYSGSLRLTVEVMTALIFGNQKKSKGKPAEISVPIDPTTGHPFISPTMIKGMISNAYERLTASRFRVFGEHNTTLTYRADPAAALGLVPVRLDDNYDLGTHRGKLLYGPGRALYAKLLTHETGDDGENKKPHPLLKKSSAWNKLQHGERIDFMAKKIKDSYIVTQIKARGDNAYLQLNVPDWVATSNSDESAYTGWFYSTTPDHLLKAGKSIFDSKLSERIFFYDHRSNEEIEIDPTVAETYDQIICSYSYDSTDPTSKTPTKPNRFVIDRAGNKDIPPINHSGLLAYARLQDKKIVELMPTQVGRRNYSRSPRSLAQEQGALPVSDAIEASPADHIFGFIPTDPQAPDNQPNNQLSTLKGRITISAVDTSSAPRNDKRLDLRPLLTPKTSSARRFLTDVSGHTISGRPRPGYYSEGDYLGAASYGFRRGDAGIKKKGDGRLDYATLASYEKEQSEENPRRQEKTNQEIYSTAISWIPRSSTFHCTIHFEGLQKEELWTLLWILDSKLLGQYARESQHQPESDQGESSAPMEGYLRMGMGKPLGLGVVRTSFSALSYVKTADDDAFALVDDYEDLEGCLGAPDPEKDTLNEEWRNEFFAEAEGFYRLLSSTPWCKAFLRSCLGYPGKTEVRYMTLSENKQNNKTESDGRVKSGRGHAPRPLAADNWDVALKIPKKQD